MLTCMHPNTLKNMTQEELKDAILKLPLSTSIESMRFRGLMSTRASNACVANGCEMLGQLTEIEPDVVLTWRNAGRKTLAEITVIQEILEQNTNIASGMSEQLSSNQIEAVRLTQQMQVLCACLSIIQSAIVGTTRDVDSVDVRKLLSIRMQMVDCVNADDSVLSDIIVSLKDILGGGAKFLSAEALSSQYELIQGIVARLQADVIRFQDSILHSNVAEVTEEIVDNVKLDTIIHENFSFLTDSEKQFCHEYYKKNDSFPLLYIVYKCLVRSEERDAQMLCSKYGLYRDQQMKSLQEIASDFDLTRERVRQLTDADGRAISRVIPQYIVFEDDFSDIDFLCEDDEIVAEIIQRENLPITAAQLIRLIDIISLRLGSDQFVKNGRWHLFTWKAYRKMDFVALDNIIKSLIPYRRTKDMFISCDLLRRRLRIYDNDSEVLAIDAIIRAYVYDKYGIEAEDGSTFVWEQTHVSDAQVLEIVQSKGGIVTKNEILEECAELYPYLKCSAMDIAQNELLASVALKGYVPASERYRYYNSIRECAEAVLYEYRTIMPLEQLLDEVLERGCTTHAASLRTLLMNKDEDTFERFVGDKWGLKALSYSSDEVVNAARPTARRKSFDERINELSTFISQNNRMPIDWYNDEEGSLGRWIRNVRAGICEPTEEQRQCFDKIIDESVHLPQNQTELTFMQNCDTYRSVVEHLNQRPSKKSRPQLCAWFDNTSRKLENKSPNCQKAFKDLTDWMEEKGIYFG